jgi:hypothetical protein
MVLGPVTLEMLELELVAYTYVEPAAEAEAEGPADAPAEAPAEAPATGPWG